MPYTNITKPTMTTKSGLVLGDSDNAIPASLFREVFGDIHPSYDPKEAYKIKADSGVIRCKGGINYKLNGADDSVIPADAAFVIGTEQGQWWPFDEKSGSTNVKKLDVGGSLAYTLSQSDYAVARKISILDAATNTTLVSIKVNDLVGGEKYSFTLAPTREFATLSFDSPVHVGADDDSTIASTRYVILTPGQEVELIRVEDNASTPATVGTFCKLSAPQPRKSAVAYLNNLVGAAPEGLVDNLGLTHDILGSDVIIDRVKGVLPTYVSVRFDPYAGKSELVLINGGSTANKQARIEYSYRPRGGATASDIDAYEGEFSKKLSDLLKYDSASDFPLKSFMRASSGVRAIAVNQVEIGSLVLQRGTKLTARHDVNVMDTGTNNLSLEMLKHWDFSAPKQAKDHNTGFNACISATNICCKLAIDDLQDERKYTNIPTEYAGQTAAQSAIFESVIEAEMDGAGEVSSLQYVQKITETNRAFRTFTRRVKIDIGTEQLPTYVSASPWVLPGREAQTSFVVNGTRVSDLTLPASSAYNAISFDEVAAPNAAVYNGVRFYPNEPALYNFNVSMSVGILTLNRNVDTRLAVYDKNEVLQKVYKGFVVAVGDTSARFRHAAVITALGVEMSIGEYAQVEMSNPFVGSFNVQSAAGDSYFQVTKSQSLTARLTPQPTRAMYKDADFTIANGNTYFVDTSNGPVVGTMPPSVTDFGIWDYENTWSNHNTCQIVLGTDTLQFSKANIGKHYTMVRNGDIMRVYSEDGFITEGKI